MKAPSPSWEADYKHDRRAQAHRCRCCNRILVEGERVIMAKVAGGKTLAIHHACGDRQHGTAEGWSWADAMACWGTESLIGCGWKIPQHPYATAHLGAA